MFQDFELNISVQLISRAGVSMLSGWQRKWEALRIPCQTLAALAVKSGEQFA